ncbi:MAG: valine--tRNA ligase [Nevskiaceae bacterium]|nr:MAG: valine--tRNA ligase [Nevskiaceae bacterium]
MDKTFEARTVEARWRETWEQSGCFAAGAGRSEGAAPYSIMIPPPNVTGSLHMGHAFQHTVMDALTRYHRMSGADTLWQPGTDHAGIATQMVVERNLKLAGEPTRAELGREKFLEKVWEWKKFSGDTIENQIRRMGSSVDWSRKAFTMDPSYSTAVIEHFVRLHDEGLIYRGKRLVNWDPVLQTAISDLEVVQEEENGKLWHIRYPLADGSGHLVVATTRPETMLGDAAVAVHPEDERYQKLIGKTVKLPLCDREIPIIGDDYVDREFGTGCVKITPAHDFNDYQVGQRHQLPLINIFTKTAFINDDAPAAYRGLDRIVARKKIVADLEAAGLMEKIEDHKLKVPRGDRTGVVLEPYLTDQWFVDLTRDTRHDGQPGPGGRKAITEPAIRAVEDGRIRFVPENWSNTYFHWLRNIQDWCISRQLWWGHRIPAWYDADGKVYVARSEAEARSKYRLDASVALKQDEDVFDTWFSSDIWPFATLGWPQQTPELKKYYPTSVLVTGFDIIFFWVARMVMMGMKLVGDVPFREVYVHGLIRDPEGQKMSKSKGNVLDPLDLVDGIALEDLVKKRTTGLMKPETAPKIEKATRKDYPNGIAAVGVDALRFTFAALASPGRDIRFDAGRAEGYRNFCNKIWNAARYVLMNCEGKDVGLDANAAVTLSAADHWIISRLQKVEAEAAEHFKTYRFDLLAKTLYEFIWNEYCDWYLELTKPALAQGDEATQRGTRRTLLRVLEAWLRLLHPLMPFITEEVWQRIAPLAGVNGPTIMLQRYPVAQPGKINEAAEADIEWLKGFILGLRQIRGEMDISPGKPLPLLLQNASPADRERIARFESSIRFLARIESLRILVDGETPPQCATALLGQMNLLVPMAGLIDKDAELARLGKAAAKLEGDMAKTEARVGNPNFGKAPEAVQQQTRDLLAKQQQDLAALRAQMARIQSL